MTLHQVAHLNNAVRKRCHALQPQRRVTMRACDEWDPLADEHGDDIDAEFVDLTCFEKRGDDLAAAHHPDMLALFLPKLPAELDYRLAAHDLVLWDVYAGIVVDFVPDVVTSPVATN